MSTTADFDSIPLSTAASCTECASCKASLDRCYYQAGNAALCGECATAVEEGGAPSGSRVGRLAKALFLGSVAAGFGALIQFAVLHFLNINAALVTIFMGIIIGGAVRAGSGGRGGWRYQLIAVLLTYMAIAAAYVPIAVAEIKAEHDKKEAGEVVAEASPGKALHGVLPAKAAPAAKGEEPATPPSLAELPLMLGLLVVAFFALPIAAGISSPLSLLIFGFGLYQAWKVNKATPVEVTGPHWHGAQPPPLPV